MTHHAKFREVGLVIWAWWSWFAGTAVIIGGLAYSMVLALDQPNPVSIHTHQQLLTPEVQAGGNLIFEVDVQRRRTCEGSIVDIFTSLRNGRKSQFVRERPIISHEPTFDRQLKIVVPVPALLEPGPAQFHSTLVSQCPEGTVHDLMAAFTFTVTPR